MPYPSLPTSPTPDFLPSGWGRPKVADLGLKAGWWSQARTALRWWMGAPWRGELQRVIAGDHVRHRLDITRPIPARVELFAWNRRLPVRQAHADNEAHNDG